MSRHRRPGVDCWAFAGRDRRSPTILVHVFCFESGEDRVDIGSPNSPGALRLIATARSFLRIVGFSFAHIVLFILTSHRCNRYHNQNYVIASTTCAALHGKAEGTEMSVEIVKACASLLLAMGLIHTVRTLS